MQDKLRLACKLNFINKEILDQYHKYRNIFNKLKSKTITKYSKQLIINSKDNKSYGK